MMNAKYTHLNHDTLKEAMDSFPLFGSGAKGLLNL